jgi:ribonuclease HI
MKEISIHTDGACSLQHGGAGGWCAILRFQNKEKIISGGESGTTNNRMELLAVIRALQELKEPCKVKLYSDSKYILDPINGNLKKWVIKGLDNYKNPDLWREYIEYAWPHEITGFWIKGHSGHPLNEKCDKIAVQESEKYKKVHKKSAANINKAPFE